MRRMGRTCMRTAVLLGVFVLVALAFPSVQRAEAASYKQLDFNIPYDFDDVEHATAESERLGGTASDLGMSKILRVGKRYFQAEYWVDSHRGDWNEFALINYGKRRGNLDYMACAVGIEQLDNLYTNGTYLYYIPSNGRSLRRVTLATLKDRKAAKLKAGDDIAFAAKGGFFINRDGGYSHNYVYRYDVKRGKLKLARKGCLLDYHRGDYAIGVPRWTDMPRPVWVFKITKSSTGLKKTAKLGSRCGKCFFKKKTLYYDLYSKDGKSIKRYRARQDGTHAKFVSKRAA